MKQYRVHISGNHTMLVTARSKRDEKEQAWNDIKDGYTYGWENKDNFMQFVIVEEV